ncbi:tyrosine-type recombinase/integrase [Edaphocola aurantiacus]|uniref:tyrosine-type recombinase/integrase n=1 Tax=Edaphocola aurantiacus TaxID=2601682 RepID=UPI001C96F6AB|nr:site-specific integrase [Edaphocola aurantiacus]
MNTREKKFFSPELHSFDNDLLKRWRVEWWEEHPKYPNGKRCVKEGNINRGNTIEERLELAQLLISDIVKKYSKSEEEPATVLHQALISGQIGWRKKTFQTYKTIINVFCEYYPRPEYATSLDVHKFLLNLKSDGMSQSTVKKYRDILAYTYEKALKNKLVKANPVDTEISIKREARSLLYFSKDQIEKIKAADKPPQLWLAIQFLFYCFIRPGEQRHMRIEWINFDEGYIEVPGQFSKNKKTEKVFIPNQFLNEILYLKDYPNSFYILSKSGVPGPEQIAQNWLNTQHSKVLKQVGIRGRYAFYSWKHTGVVLCVKAGIGLKDLQLQLRHHSLDMVNQYLKDLGVLDCPDLRDRFPSL